MKAGPCNHNLKVLLVSVLLHLLFELFHTAGLDLVDQLAEDDSVLQNLPEVTGRERLSHHLLHPLGEKDEDNDVRFIISPLTCITSFSWSLFLAGIFSVYVPPVL